MSDLRFETHRAALAEIGRLTALDQLITRGDRRRLVREARDWYLETRASNATRNGTCVVVTAGPPGAANRVDRGVQCGAPNGGGTGN